MGFIERLRYLRYRREYLEPCNYVLSGDEEIELGNLQCNVIKSK